VIRTENKIGNQTAKIHAIVYTISMTVLVISGIGLPKAILASIFTTIGFPYLVEGIVRWMASPVGFYRYLSPILISCALFATALLIIFL
jgi:hypothetical protein